jgi:two-component system OmpR family sensor kinase/two-component system sensor histidine kinase BaeS
VTAPPPQHARKPPWWPEGEPWPPGGRPPFAGRLLRRIAIALLLFFALGAVLSIISGLLWGRHDRPGPWFGPFFPLALAALLLFVGSRVARRYAQPLGGVLDTIERLAAGDYAARAPASGPPEIRALGDAVNVMAGRLAASEEQRRNLVADIAHEVRTPLAIIRGNVEGILDNVYAPDPERLAPILEEVEVITRLIDDLQTLSSAEAGMLRLHPESLDVGILVEDVARAFEPQAAGKGVAIRVDVQRVAPVTADGARVRQVIENLLTNALRHTPAGGSIHVRLCAGRHGLEVQVVDTGSGIAPEDLPHIFERYRKAPDSTGSGLGLAIARRLVEAHRGSITAASEPGSGTTISFTLPADSA